MYRISNQKNELIWNMGWFKGETWRWTLTWLKQFDHDEMKQAEELEGMLTHHCPKREVSDQVFWGSKGAFASKDLTKKVNKLYFQGALVDNLVSFVWMKLTPPKVEFCMWLALLGKLNTKDLLLHKGVLPP